MISLEAVGKDFLLPQAATLTILDDVTLTLPEKRSSAIVGRSGSGKSTLLSLLSGLERPTRGRIIVDGTNITSLSEAALSDFRATRVGIVFQSFHLLGHFTALANVLLAAELAGVSSPLARAREALAEVGLGDRMNHHPTRLSGGEQQRVAIARALVSRPRILLCDEPTGNLDPENAERVFSLLTSLCATHGTTLVLITHDVSLAAACSYTNPRNPIGSSRAINTPENTSGIGVIHFGKG